MADFLPYGRHAVSDVDVEAVSAVLRGDALTCGPIVNAYEADFAAAVGANHAVACNSGTAALHLAMLAIGLGPGDLAVVPTITFLATANAVRMVGADVVFADVDPDSGLLTADTLRAALDRVGLETPVKAAVPVHLNGRPCDMAALAEVTAPRGIDLVEDACHALGAAGIGETRHSRIACFSTHPVKAIATGEGGVAVSGDAALAKSMRRLRSHGMVREAEDMVAPELSMDQDGVQPWSYEMQQLGWNYRMPDILCALGRSQLARLPQMHARRREIADLYDRLLQPLTWLKPVTRGLGEHGHHLYPVLIDFPALGTSRSRFIRALQAKGIGTQVHYAPVHRQPYYAARTQTPILSGAEAYYARCLSLPFFPGMSDTDVARVVDALAAMASA